jgi:hypothetical protein
VREAAAIAALMGMGGSKGIPVHFANRAAYREAKRSAKGSRKRESVGTRRQVYNGHKTHTKSGGSRKKPHSGLYAKDILYKGENGTGKRYVSKKKSAKGIKDSKNVSTWIGAATAARDNLNIEGFVAMGGGSAAGERLYDETRRIYEGGAARGRVNGIRKSRGAMVRGRAASLGARTARGAPRT